MKIPNDHKAAVALRAAAFLFVKGHSDPASPIPNRQLMRAAVKYAKARGYRLDGVKG